MSVFSANVLLDLSFRAKVGDFGLARPIHDADTTRTNRVVGTSGYIPPEYYRGTITTKMDTYAFGVVRQVNLISWPKSFLPNVIKQILLEMISGLPSYDPHRTPKDLVECW